MTHRFDNYVGGAWVAGGAGELTVFSPATGDPVGVQQMADAQDVDRAVAAARQCHQNSILPDMRPSDRARMVRSMGDYLLAHIDQIAGLLSREAGKPLWESRIEVKSAARIFEYYGCIAEAVEGKTIPLGSSYLDFTLVEPHGVTAHIVPWNFPVEIIARSTAAALAAGNTCVVKTPELTPLAASFIAKAAEAAGLPEGAFNLLCGYGPEAGAALSGHKDIDHVVFTGSVPTGIAVGKASMANLVPSVLELGGKSAAIVYPDADVKSVADSVRWGTFYNAGQICSALSRLIVHHKIYDDVIEAVSGQAAGLRLSAAPSEELSETAIGTLVSPARRDVVLNMCNTARDAGAKLVTGGVAPNVPGAFVPPTVFADVDPNSELAREEVFGPVLAVTAFDTDAEAIKLANGTDYGLVAGVFTSDLERAVISSRKLQAGQVFVNEWFAGGVETPFGGAKKSGIGREKGHEGLMNYLQTKNVAIANLA